MNKPALIFIVLLISWTPAAVAADTGGSNAINWSSYAEAKSNNSENRNYLVYFYTDRCPACTMLKKKTFSNKAIIEYINSNYTPVKVNASKEFKLASSFGIQGVPDLRFLTPKGKKIGQWLGFIESKQLLPLLQYIHTGSYENVSYRDFLKKRKNK